MRQEEQEDNGDRYMDVLPMTEKNDGENETEKEMERMREKKRKDRCKEIEKGIGIERCRDIELRQWSGERGKIIVVKR